VAPRWRGRGGGGRLPERGWPGQIGTGFSEEALEAHHAFFKDHTLPKPKPYYKYHESLACDVWFDAVQVWEIKAADLSLSPKHLAAIGQVRRCRCPMARDPRAPYAGRAS
jgi:DNA ligase 1